MLTITLLVNSHWLVHWRSNSSNQLTKLTWLPQLYGGGGYLMTGLHNLPDSNNHLHSSDLNHSGDNLGSLTHWAIGELPNLNILLPYDPAFMLLSIYPKGLKTMSTQTPGWMDVYSSSIHNWSKLEATKMSFSQWMDELVHPDSGMLLSTKKWATKPWQDRKET